MWCQGGQEEAFQGEECCLSEPHAAQRSRREDDVTSAFVKVEDVVKWLGANLIGMG